MKPIIKLKDVTKEFGGNVVLRGIDLDIMPNEFVTLLGPSGCGKTTTLRIIGGFIEPSSGEVLFEEKSVLDIPAHLRPTNTVFQRYSLFPHLNVFENVAYGLRVKPFTIKQQSRLRELKRKLREDLVDAEDSEETRELKKAYKDKVRRIKNPNWYIKRDIKRLRKEYEELLDDEVMELEFEQKLEKLEDKLLTKEMKERRIKREVVKYLKLVGLEGFEERSIDKLSGGQQQRVAIARALINKPKVLLLDEPLAALDLKLRQEMQYELKELQQSAGITFIFVTHDQEEALTMSDKIVVMNNGEIQQIGTPEDIYNEPINRFVASFIGESNIIEAIMLDDLLVSFDGKKYDCVDSGFHKNERVEVVIRPEDIDIVSVKDGFVKGIVDSVAFKGVHYEIDVLTKDRVYTIHTTDIAHLGDEVGIRWNPEDIHVMEIW